jgi:hypothetical protein
MTDKYFANFSKPIALDWSREQVIDVARSLVMSTNDLNYVFDLSYIEVCGKVFVTCANIPKTKKSKDYYIDWKRMTPNSVCCPSHDCIAKCTIMQRANKAKH